MLILRSLGSKRHSGQCVAVDAAPQLIVDLDIEDATPWPRADDQRGRLDIREFEPNLLDLFAAANLVIARGGYNTVLELREVGVPALCIPVRHGSTESQEGRIRQAAGADGRIQLVGLGVDELARTLRDVAGEPMWRYEPYDGTDGIAANKQALARWLVGLSLERGSTLAA